MMKNNMKKIFLTLFVIVLCVGTANVFADVINLPNGPVHYNNVYPWGAMLLETIFTALQLVCMVTFVGSIIAFFVQKGKKN